MFRRSVNKRKSAKAFRSSVSKTDRKNLIHRGGYRL